MSWSALWRRALAPLSLLSVLPALLVACGGGSAPVAPSVSGVAAVGAPLVGANVDFACNAGAPAPTLTNASGQFSVPSGSITFPCIARASGGTRGSGGAANSEVLYSVALGSGTANITPLTTLLVGALAGQPLDTWFAGLKAAPAGLAAVTPAAVQTALTQVNTLLAGLPSPVSLPAGVHPVSSTFVATTSNAIDQLIEQAVATLTANTVTLADAAAQAAANQPLVEPTPHSIALEKIGGFTHSGGVAAAEVTAYDPLSKRLFVVNGALGTVDVLSIANPAAPVQVGTVTTAQFGAGLGGANSVAVRNGIVALAIEASPKTGNGVVGFLRASDLTVLGAAPAGALPDMLTFTPDGRHILVANEGEPSSYGQMDSVDPEGSITVLEVAGLLPTASTVQFTATQVSFTAFNSQIDTLRAQGVRIFGPGATVAQDLEPEYIAVSHDSRTAWITLQENNAVAVLDIPTRTITAVRALGLKDHSLAGMGLDLSNEDGGTNTNSGTPTIRIQPYPVKGMYMPDAIASFRIGSQTYLITANEGDAREYTGIDAKRGTTTVAAGREDPRVRDLCPTGVDPETFGVDAATAANLVRDSNLGRLRVTALPNGDRQAVTADGKCRELLAFGARSITIWSSDLERVWDSGDALEQRSATLWPALFNASHDNATLDDRSPAKGPEPEVVVVARLGTKVYAFVGLERIGGVAVWEVTDPTAPQYVTWLNTREGASGGDRGPEGLLFIKAADSPNGKPLLIVGNEASGTTAILQINMVAAP